MSPAGGPSRTACDFKHFCPMKILILSDLCLSPGPVMTPTVVPDVDVVVLAGNIMEPATAAVQWARHEPAFRRAKAVVFVPGELEHWSSLPHDAVTQMRQAAVGSRVHILDSTELVVHGVRFLGLTLWSNFELGIKTSVGLLSNPQLAMDVERASMDWQFEKLSEKAYFVDEAGDGRPLPTPEQSLWRHRASTRWLSDKLAEPFAGKTVVVSHHGPHRKSVNLYNTENWSSPAAVNDLPQAFFDVPSLWIHGHEQSCCDYQVKQCRVKSNAQGYASKRPGIPQKLVFDPGCTVLL